MSEKLLSENVFVKTSDIHGKGIYTSVNIKKGTKILVIEGDVINGDECLRRENEEDNVYIFWNGDDIYIDTAKSDKIKYINHNCNFNCDVWDRDKSSLYLVAYKNISAGEELTIDYGYDEIYENCCCEKCLIEAN